MTVPVRRAAVAALAGSLLLPMSAVAEVALRDSGGTPSLQVRTTPSGLWSPIGQLDGEAILNPTGDLRGDGYPGHSAAGGALMAAWVRPSEATVELSLAREGRWALPITVSAPGALGVPRVLAHSEGWWVAWSDGEGRSALLLDRNGEVSGRMADATDAHLLGAWTVGSSLQILELDALGRLRLVAYGYVPGPIPVDIARVALHELDLAPTGSPEAAVSLRQVLVEVDGSNYLAWQFGGESRASFVSLDESGATSNRRHLEIPAQPKSATTSPLEAALRRAVR